MQDCDFWSLVHLAVIGAQGSMELNTFSLQAMKFLTYVPTAVCHLVDKLIQPHVDNEAEGRAQRLPLPSCLLIHAHQSRYLSETLPPEHQP